MNGSRPAGQCPHRPSCPASSQPGRLAAAVIFAHPGQGWSLLCNGIVVFNDTSAECPHWPPCPASSQPGRLAAAVISAHPEQGWSLLCNGVVVFDDTGYLLPDGTARGPRHPGRVPARATA